VSILLRQLSKELDALLVGPASKKKLVQGNLPPNPFGLFPFGLFPEQHETDRIAGSFSTWFRHWGGIIGAAHSVEAWPEDRAQWPDWTQDKSLILRPAGLDVAVQFDDGSVLAVGGMSGGVGTTVLPGGAEIVTSIIITQNSRADLDADGDEDHSSDVTELIDVWAAVRAQKSAYV